MNSVFAEIYEKYHRDLFQFLFYMVRNRELAEDLVQEVYIRVMKSYDRFEGKSSLKTWLFTIARNVAIDHFRKEQNLKKRIFSRTDWKERKMIDEHPLPEEIAMQNEKIQLLYRSLNECTVDQRTVLIARFIQQLSIMETAEILGWTESKVKTTQHRALKVVRKAMEKEGIDEW
ncbi:RNA polymerase sigma factor SigX [Fervidibacillus halotolerans]|uniref:RNA polymerase sigma factor n=1 Tax=Fervidibacillus halotolerans TaxID=2980027 RepID=A0A9E8M3A4_9BACI|nr:RNA polymerase sigma factor SigX [Fervidibacillus halotolerans]WAA13796.1 RNA polymerase sigma factor SigX [Fervidibacillus halotolerans]